MENTKIKMLLLMLNAEAIEDVKHKLAIAYGEECIKFSNHVLEVGLENVPEPARLRHIAELIKLLEERQELGLS